MMLIMLSRGQVAKVDDEDFEKLNQFKWTAFKYRDLNWYAIRGLDGRTKYMQHDVLGFKEGLEIDHIDGDGLNNQKSNLRFLTHQLNLMNRGPQKNNTSGYKGVTANHGKWQALIRVNKKSKHLGLFKTPEEAAERYNRAARHYFGDVAYQNKIEMRVQAEQAEETTEE